MTFGAVATLTTQEPDEARLYGQGKRLAGKLRWALVSCEHPPKFMEPSLVQLVDKVRAQANVWDLDWFEDS